MPRGRLWTEGRECLSGLVEAFYVIVGHGKVERVDMLHVRGHWDKRRLHSLTILTWGANHIIVRFMLSLADIVSSFDDYMP